MLGQFKNLQKYADFRKRILYLDREPPSFGINKISTSLTLKNLFDKPILETLDALINTNAH